MTLDTQKLRSYQEWERRSLHEDLDLLRAAADHIDAQEAEIERLRKALSDIADLYDTDEGCRSLPEYIAARAALSGESNGG